MYIGSQQSCQVGGAVKLSTPCLQDGVKSLETQLNVFNHHTSVGTNSRQHSMHQLQQTQLNQLTNEQTKNLTNATRPVQLRQHSNLSYIFTLVGLVVSTQASSHMRHRQAGRHLMTLHTKWDDSLIRALCY